VTELAGRDGVDFAFSGLGGARHGFRLAHATPVLSKIKIHASQYVYLNAEYSKCAAGEGAVVLASWMSSLALSVMLIFAMCSFHCCRLDFHLLRRVRYVHPG
jgi:hypothetical protein